MFLSEYASGLVIIAFLAAFAELISYSAGEDRGHKLAVSVVLLYSLIAPLVPLVKNVGDFDFSEIMGDGEITSGGAYLEVSEEAFQEGILRSVTEKWGLDKDKTVVTVTGFDFENMRAELIKITLLSKGYTVDFREIEAYIEKNGLGECEVGYAIK